MTPLVVDPSGYLKPHHSVGHCQPHRTLTHIIGVLHPASLLCHGSILSRVGACEYPVRLISGSSRMRSEWRS